MRFVVVVLLLLTVTGCAARRGFDRGSLLSQISEKKEVTEEDIKKVLDLKPQLSSPFRMAIYFAPPQRGYYDRSLWHWTGEDKDKLLAIRKELVTKGIVSDLFTIGNDLVDGTDLKAIRLAAARAGADAVLVVNGVADLDRYNNAFGYSYVLIVTPLFVPGTEVESLFLASALLWDVRNQYLYLSAEGDGTAQESKPAAFVDEARVTRTAKAAALMNLQAELLSRFQGNARKEGSR